MTVMKYAIRTDVCRSSCFRKPDVF